MATGTRRSAGGKSAHIETVTIPAGALAELEQAPDRNYRREFEPWEDEVIRRYINVKSFPTIAKVLKTTTAVIRRRVKELGLA